MRKRPLMHRDEAFRIRRRVALVVTVVLTATLAPAIPAQADDGRGRPAVARTDKTVKGHRLKARLRKPDPATRRQRPPKVTWPKGGTAEVTLPAVSPPGARSAGNPPAVRAGRLPVWVGAPLKPSRRVQEVPSRVKIQVLNRTAARRAGIDGLLFTVARTDPATATGRVGLSVDYSGFVNAFGGSYGARLRLFQMPSCVLRTPHEPGCRKARPVGTRNDEERKALESDVDVAPAAAGMTVLAATAGAASDKGDYTATSLSPSATWQVGEQTGDFSWSYPMRVPPVPGDLTPKLAIAYSSGSTDGRTSNTNGQPSWVGEGFDLWPGYIERRYKACADDGAPKDPDGNDPGDQCWAYDNATISFNGKAGELIPAGNGIWRLKDDDGSRIEKVTGADNGDDDGEYWKFTTTDGVQYFFGRDRLPGWGTGKAETDSTWTVPVFGNDSGEPCHKDTGFADSWCRQAWRWNLDYVVDPHGNVVTYYYTPETNHYARNLKASDGTVYTRGGYLDHIEYGLRSDDLFAKAPARVDFGVSERCVADATFDCDPAKIGDKPDYWWDVPWDMNCNAGADCKDTNLNIIKASATFWSRKRLTKVTTRVLKPDASGYQDVDAWDLTHKWGSADVDRDLLLDSITHTGLAGATPITLPPVTFNHVQLANRVDKLGDDIGPYIKYRLGTVFDESGGQLDVNYSAPECTLDTLPTPETNTKRCYPVYWTPPDGSKDPKLDWFHKYVVAQVVQTDRTGHAPDQVTNYDYQDGTAWHYDDDDGLTKEKYKTWSQWRGYGQVRVRSGGANDMRTQTDHFFFRGMDGDRLNKEGGTKNVTVSDGEGGTYPDEDVRQGFGFKTTDYLKPGGGVTSKTISTIWTHQTAKRVRSWGTSTANLTGTASTRTLTALEGGNWRETLVKNTYDDVTGLQAQVDDQGDTSVAGDDRCTDIMYAANTGAWMLKYPSREETVAVRCGGAVDRPAQVISDMRRYFDNGAYGAGPSRGDVTKEEEIAEYVGGAPKYVPSKATSYDVYGRAIAVTDAAGHTTTTGYTPVTGLPTSATMTGPPITPGDATTAMTTTTTLDPAWNLATSKTDAGGKRTDLEYDALGRLVNVWLPNSSKVNNQTPNLSYAYLINRNAPVAVRTKTIRPDSSQMTGYQLYDGFLRPRQVQELGPNGGRLISDTFYDGQGETARTYATYYAAGAPEAALFGVAQPGDVESQTAYDHDGLGRVTTERFLTGNGDGQEKWRTTTTYSGDRVTIDPPAGTTPTTTISDARGNTTEVRQYKADGPTGDYDATTYTYTPAGKLAAVTDAVGNTWTHTYDLRGREIKVDDPDKGVATTDYDDVDQVTSTQDARGKKLFYGYDAIGRKIAERDGSATGPVLTSWAYDTVRKGQLTSVTRTIGGADYVERVNAYDNLNQPIRTTYTIPSVAGEAGLAGSYQFNTRYNLDNTVQSTGLPAGGGMTAEAVTTTYDELRRPIKTTGSISGYVTNTLYSLTGKPNQLELSGGVKRAWLTYSYEYGTQRLAESRTDREGIAGVDRDARYTYDDAGDVTSTTDISRSGTDTQCFGYDYLKRLTQAWTPTGGCATPPAKNALGGPAPYWTSYSYDATGNRTKEIQHGTTSVATDTTRTYDYPAPGQGQHRLASVTQTGAAGDRSDGFSYDAAGNTTRRSIGSATQSLVWDPEGHLASSTDSSGTTTYAYDASGDRLLRREPGATTLYLPNMELRLDKTTGQVSGTRYYAHGGALVAMRTSTGVRFISADPHGSAELAISATDQSEAQRRFAPFGQFRGTPTGVWPNDKGFVGGTIDATGLTHLGAREYDPATGRFISVDPLFDLENPQSWNGYAYAGNNPTTTSDPDGRMYPWDMPHPSPKGGSGGGGGSAKPPKPDYPFPTDDLNGAPPAVRKHEIRYRVEILKHDGGPRYNQALVAFCAEYRGDYMCSSPDAKAVLSIMGMTPGPVGVGADVAIVIAQAYHGNWSGMAATLFFLIPFLGDAAEAGHVAKLLRQERKAAKLCANSFLAGTHVLLSDGTYKNIEDVRVGDKVLATDPKTGKTTARPVIASFGGTDYAALIQVTVDIDGKRGHRTGVVIATEHHRFWNQTRRTWTRADRLTPGTKLRTPTGRTLGVLSTTHRAGHPAVHDLTIAGTHTYYVQAGTTPVLVHNAGGCINWSWKSVKTFGHTFSEHGAGAKNTQSLLDRARSTGNQQGQWLDNEAAAEFLRGVHVPDSGVFGVRLPDGLGQVIMPDGSIRSAPYAYVVPNSRGVIRTAYPTLGEP